ncbi:hypothetical protein DV702_08525 [Sporosarcina sp. PTS2304]|uniref:hypothetical protein n=1 Tax=Sporosarcina sp. PTS2304 TaxID=2283194 RepID=UPI000E0D2959|nr:hypothetical protein [Sporosarcina sp. PTS2304]AXH99772.1 hypothetical protein DV702_08525 [Sporosarcina sp. PTS2304]
MKITPNPANFRIPQTPKPATEKEEAPKKHESAAKQPVDRYTPSENVPKVGYDKPTTKVDTASIERLKAESEKAHENLRNLVRQLLERQGITMEDAMSGKKEVVVDEQARLDAQAAIGEGGESSPENVSDRIVDFAKAISGGDKSKFELLKGAIEDGFAAAKNALGGTLPEISQKTFDLVMEKLNQWKDEE